MKPLYKINDLSFSYSSDRNIFKNINLKLDFETTTLLSGKNGSGKTTFCHLLTGLLTGFNGSIILEDINLRELQVSKIAKKIIYIKQEILTNIVATTPAEDLAIWQHKFCIKDNINFEKKRTKVLIYFNIYNLKNNPVWELSSGQIKRISLSALLLNEDKYWILDEPFGCLDDKSVELLLYVLDKRKKSGKGCLLITHQLEECKSIADRWFQIEDKNIIEKGSI